MIEGPSERKKRLARERSRRFREKNPGYEREKSKKFRRENPGYRFPRQLELVQEVNEIKSGPCLDCGRIFPTICMDFDHRPGAVKVGNVGTMVSAGRARDVVMAEIEKCDLVCANCHRVRTWERSFEH